MFNEEILEKITLELLYDLGYECINGYNLVKEDFSKVILEKELEKAILRINTNINDEQVKEVIKMVRNLEHNNTILNNKQ